MNRTDYLYDTDSDLLISNGDFVSGNAALQQAILILQSSKGEIRQYPLVGAGFTALLGSNLDTNIIEQLAKSELLADNIRIKEIEVTRTTKDFKLNIKV